MTEYEDESGVEPELVRGPDESRFVEMGVVLGGRIAHVEIDGAWSAELTTEEFADALMGAYGNASVALVERLSEQNDSSAGGVVPPVTPISERVRRRVDERRAEGAAVGDRQPAEPSARSEADERRREDQLEEAMRTVELAGRAREERAGYQERLIELHTTEFEDSSSEHTLTVVSRYGTPVRFELSDIWTRRRAEPLARAVIEVTEAAAARREELDRQLAVEFPATTELIARSTTTS